MAERTRPVLTRPSVGRKLGVPCSSAWLDLAADKLRNQLSTETGLDAVDAPATRRQLVQAIGCIRLSSLRNAQGGCSVGVLIEIFSLRRRIKAQATDPPQMQNNGEAVGRAQRKKGHFQRPQLSRAPKLAVISFHVGQLGAWELRWSVVNPPTDGTLDYRQSQTPP